MSNLKRGWQWVSMDRIAIHTKGHKGPVDFEHRWAIEDIKFMIVQGRFDPTKQYDIEGIAEPIVVDVRGKRVAGFKRLTAYKELGHKKVWALVVPLGRRHMWS